MSSCHRILETTRRGKAAARIKALRRSRSPEEKEQLMVAAGRYLCVVVAFFLPHLGLRETVFVLSYVRTFVRRICLFSYLIFFVRFLVLT